MHSALIQGTRPPNLLVIDDEESICCLLHEVLSERGYHTEIAMTGEDALEKVQRIPFDVILSDICLPGLSGIEVLRAVRSRGLPARVILISGFANLEMALEALREGAVDLIPKPIHDLELVLRSVERALARRPEIAAAPESPEARATPRLAEAMLKACARLAAQVTDRQPALFLAECAATTGTTLGARRVEIDLAAPGEDLPSRTVWPEGQAAPRPEENRRERDTLTHPIMVAGHTLGALRVTGVGGAASRGQLDFLDAVAALTGTAVERAEAREEREASFVRFLEYLVHMRETMAGFEEGHSSRVADLSSRLGRALGFSERGLGLLRRAAAFHDLGKLGVDPELLNRPGPLTPDELAAVRRHGEMAERLLGASACLEDVRHILRHLGSQPSAAAGHAGAIPPEVPLEARILIAAEAFISMTSPRPHRPALGSHRALEEMRREIGGRFDAEVVETLENLLAGGSEEEAPACGIPQRTL